jgi:GNAT superfamily N-acetyltransferase
LKTGCSVLSPSSIDFRPVVTDEEWSQAQGLIQELIHWDVRECESLGFERDEVIGTFYPEGLADVRRQSAAPAGCFLIARCEDHPAGCAGYRPLTARTCELYNVYVAATSRGLGVGAGLVAQLKRRAAAVGYETMCLETASFMTHAHTLYRSLQFETVSPYRSIPKRFLPITFSMQCALKHPNARLPA